MNGGCYKVVAENLNWTDAGLRCRALHKDAHLLVIDDAAEQSAVAEMLTATDRQYYKFLICCLTLIPRYVDFYAPGGTARYRPTIRYDTEYLTCSKKLTDSQLSLSHGMNKKFKQKIKLKIN